MSAPRGPGAPRPLPTRLTRPGRPCAILVAEDDRATGELLQEALADAGHRATLARGLAEIEGALATVRFDLVLAAAPLAGSAGPRGDRWDALERVRALAGGAPVVVVTAQHSGYFADWHARGFAALLAKPLNLDDLLATIDGQLAPGWEGGGASRGAGIRSTPEGEWRPPRETPTT